MKLEWKTCWRIAVTALGIYLLIHYWAAFSHLFVLGLNAAVPLFLGCAIAYVVNILMSFYEKYYVIICKKAAIQKMKRPFCMFLAFLSVFLVVVVISQMIFPELAACISMLVENLPDALNTGYDWLEENFHISRYLSDNMDMLKNHSFDWESIVKKGVDLVLSGVGGAMGSIISILSSLFSMLVTILLGFIFSIYLLSGKEKLGANFRKLMHTYMSSRREEQLLYVVRTINHSFHSFIVGQCVEAVILGTLCVIGMLIFRFPYATMIGCLVGFTALIPVAGAYIGAIVGAFMIFTVSPFQALMFIIFLAILQQIEGNLIYPRVVGSSIGLPGIWVLAAVTVGGGVLGIGGMLVGVPLTAAAYQLLRRDLKKRGADKTDTESIAAECQTEEERRPEKIKKVRRKKKSE